MDRRAGPNFNGKTDILARVYGHNSRVSDGVFGGWTEGFRFPPVPPVTQFP